jgi:hypothetical protein
MGRFMSPDWSAKEVPVPYAKLDNPQSLNLYSYVYNNPLRSVDVDGHGVVGVCRFVKDSSGSHQECESIDEIRDDMKKYGDKAKSLFDNTKAGYDFAAKLSGDYKDAFNWSRTMNNAWNDYQDDLNGKGSLIDSDFHLAMYQYAQAQTMYHAYEAGVTLDSLESMTYANPIARIATQFYHNLVTVGAEESLRGVVDAKHAEFVAAQKQMQGAWQREADAEFNAKYRFTDSTHF